MPEIIYTHHRIPKGKGKYRHIYAPSEELKAYQVDILKQIYNISPHPANHGFIPFRSIVSNAAQHVGRKYVLSMDIKDFFPSTTTSKVEEIFSRFFPDQIENLPYVLYKNHLPQGAPTSPYLANFALYNFDILFSKYCEDRDAVYTRYADDLTVSFDNLDVKSLLKFVNKHLNELDYYLSFKKTHLSPRWRRQQVTGIVVNEKLSIPHEVRNQLRAYNHLINKNKFNEDQIPWVMGLNGYKGMIK